MAYNGSVGTEYTGSTYMAETLTGAYSALSFKYTAYGSSSFLLDGRILADISTDDGGSWQNLMALEVHTSDQAMTPVSTSFGPYQYVRLRFRFFDLTCTYSRQRANIDTIALVPEPFSLGALLTLAGAGALALLRRS